MPPLPKRPLVDTCTTTADSLSRGTFSVPSGGVLSLCAWGFFRAWVRVDWMPGPPSPAARSPPQRT